MVFLPMVERELRGSARKRSSYGTRFATALASLLVAAWLWLMMHGQPDRVIGQILFYSVSVVAFFQTLVVGLVGAADCLSEEKREGTLGLLFLTDLKGFDVVLGKLAASSCTALYATLAIFPVLALPILLGGVTGLEFARVVLVATNNLFLSLAVAILCSSLSRNERKARGATLVILLFLAVGIPFLVEIATEYPGHTWKGWYYVFLLPSPGFACYGAFDPVARLMGRASQGGLGWLFWGSVAAIHVEAWLALLVACWILPRTWQDRPLAPPKGSWRERMARWKFGDPQVRRQRRTRLLETNPLLWLTSRDKLKDGLPWIWLGSVGLIWLWVRLKEPGAVDAGLYVIMGLASHSMFKIWIATEAPRQLAADRRSGALELILSTRVSVREIIQGQHLTLLRQFGWPTMVVLAVDLVCLLAGLAEQAVREQGFWILMWLGGMVIFLADLVTLGWLGPWLGLTSRRQGHAPVDALGRICVLPWALFGALLAGAALLREFWDVRILDNKVTEVTLFWIWFWVSLLNDVLHLQWAKHRLETDFRKVAAARFDRPSPRAWLRRIWQQVIGSPS